MSADTPENPNEQVERPSLFGGQNPPPAAAGPMPAPPEHANTMVDLLYDGFYMLFLLNNGRLPNEAQDFAESVQGYLDEVDRAAKKLGVSTDDIHSAKYAFCAAVDETVLRSGAPIRNDWERRPLQLTMFGDQLAGEHFFSRLEQLRAEGKHRLQALEVYYMCLLLGFQGKYALEGTEQLGYLSARLGDEIASMKGRRAKFSPHWEAPDSVAHTLKREVPIWVVASVCALIAVLALIGLNTSLSHSTQVALNDYHNVVQLPASAAHLTITLP